MHIVDFSASIRHTSRFLDIAIFISLIKAGISIRLQYALMALQVRLRMDALTISAVTEPYRRG